MEYAGEIFLGNSFMYADPPGISVDLQRDLPTVRGGTQIDSARGTCARPGYNALVSPEPQLAYNGNVRGCFEELMNKVIVMPRRYACGYVLNDIKWKTHVWNTHKDVLRTITDIVIQDSGNVQVSNPAGFPLIIAPMNGINFETTVPRDGDITINACATWVVTDESGTDEVITGLRIALLPSAPDWSEPIKERTQYLTDILAAYSGKEQRFALRQIPRTRLDFRLMPADRREAAGLEALLFGNSGRVYAVPFWPDAMKITQDVVLGDTVIHVDTTHRKFAPGSILMLWREFYSSEAASIRSVDADRITLTAPINGSWAADGRTYAIPALGAIIEGEASLGRLSSNFFDSGISFLCDPAADVAPAAPGLVYGYDVFPWQPNWDADRMQAYANATQLVDESTGKFKLINRSGVAIGRSAGLITLSGRQEIADYRAWLALRKGRHHAFWLPTWQNDLVLNATINAGTPSLAIEQTGYINFQYARACRRYLAFIMLDGTGRKFYRKVTDAVRVGSVETLTLDNFLDENNDIQPGSVMLSFLNLVRLDNDEPELQWYTRDAADVMLDFSEVPLEVTL